MQFTESVLHSSLRDLIILAVSTLRWIAKSMWVMTITDGIPGSN